MITNCKIVTVYIGKVESWFGIIKLWTDGTGGSLQTQMPGKVQKAIKFYNKFTREEYREFWKNGHSEAATGNRCLVPPCKYWISQMARG